MGLFDAFMKKPETSKDMAKGRLIRVLIQDRANCSPQILEMLKRDIIEVIKNYMEIDEDGLDIQLSQTELLANIPIKSIKRTD